MACLNRRPSSEVVSRHHQTTSEMGKAGTAKGQSKGATKTKASAPMAKASPKKDKGESKSAIIERCGS